MKANDFFKELNLENKALSITLAKSGTTPENPRERGCSMKLLNRAVNGEAICFNQQSLSCPGAARGMGFFDGCPQIKGGFGYFISYGAGEGFPEGERMKNTPETAMEMLQNQPVDVLGGYDFIIVKPYEEQDNASLVSFLAEPDQLSGLIQLFSYRTGAYDNIIAPMCSGCASVFRIPLGELKRENPRAVIGSIDSFSRVHFDKNTFFFTIPAKSFHEMLDDADNSFLIASSWKGVKQRLLNS